MRPSRRAPARATERSSSPYAPPKDAQIRHAPEEAREIVERALQVLELEPEPNESWEAQLRFELAETHWGDRESYEAEYDIAARASPRIEPPIG